MDDNALGMHPHKIGTFTSLPRGRLCGDCPCTIVRGVNTYLSEYLLGITYTERMPWAFCNSGCLIRGVMWLLKFLLHK